MSTQYKSPKEVPIEVLIVRLKELAEAVTKGRESVGREFTMRIPAECDRDADIVISEAARRLAALESQPGGVVAAVTKSHISEAIFGYGLRNDDGNNLSMDDTDEIAEYILARAGVDDLQPNVPDGWKIVRADSRHISVMHPDGTWVTIADTGPANNLMFYELCLALTTSQEQKP